MTYSLSVSEQRVILEGTDPIDSDELQELRIEILRLRDLGLGLESHSQVLADRVVELETQNTELDGAISTLARAVEAQSNELQRIIGKIEEANQALHVENQALLVDNQALHANNNELNEANQALHANNNELNEANQALHVELGRSPVIRIARAVARRLKLR